MTTTKTNTPMARVTLKRYEERLSSRDRRRGVKVPKGWWKLATGTDRQAVGGYAILGEFLPDGEQEIPVGSVLVEGHPDKSARVVYATRFGLARWTHDEETGEKDWYCLKDGKLALCDEIEAALAASEREALERSVAIHTLRVGYLEARHAHAAEQKGMAYALPGMERSLEAARANLTTAQENLAAVVQEPEATLAEHPDIPGVLRGVAIALRYSPEVHGAIIRAVGALGTQVNATQVAAAVRMIAESPEDLDVDEEPSAGIVVTSEVLSRLTADIDAED